MLSFCSQRGNCLPGCVTLEILRLTLEKPGPNFLAREMITSWIVDVLGGSYWNVGIHELVVLFDEIGPFVVLWHGNRTSAKFVDGIVCSVCVSLQNARIRIVRLLDLANDDRLQFSTRVLKVQVCLIMVSQTPSPCHRCDNLYLVQIVLLVNLSLQLSVDR